MAQKQLTTLGRSDTCLRMICLAALCGAVPQANAGSNLPPANIIQSQTGNSDISVSLEPSPGAVADAYSNSGGNGGQSSALVNYYLQVNGPSGVQVPLNITSTVGCQVTGAISGRQNPLQATGFNSFAAVGLRLFQANSTTFNSVSLTQDSLAEGQSPSQTSFNVSDLAVTTGALTEFSVYAAVVLAPSVPGAPDVHLEAFVDPVITFAPGFDPAGFTLEFSPGVGDAFPSVVPEPASLTLCGLALAAGLACRGWRRWKSKDR
jgi:hypothetical protein